jgi:hypothetical protein
VSKSKLVPKFKKGDKVMILPRKKGQIHHAPDYTDNMTDFEGIVVKIRQVNDTKYFGAVTYELERVGYTWREEWLSDKPMKLQAIQELLG